METRTRRARRPLLRSWRFWVPVTVVLVLFGAIAGAVAIVPAALQAESELEKAFPYAADAQKAVEGGDTAGATTASEKMRVHTVKARAATQSALWSVLEVTPWLGSNLSAIRVAAEEADRVTADAVIPMAGVQLASIESGDGRIDIDAIRALSTTVADARETADLSASRLNSVDRTSLLAPVASGVDKVAGQIAALRPTLSSVDDGLKALPAVLGGTEPRNYLLLFQNNGEVMPGGGTIGSLAEVRVEDGSFTITRQTSASARDFPSFPEPVVTLPPGSRETYPFGLGTQVQSLTRTPRFSVTAEVASEMWKRVYGVDVDGVIAVDTVALAYIVAATGPVDLPDGSQLTGENAVPLLLGDLYKTFDPQEVDVINQAVGSAAFSRIASGQVDVASLATAVTRASAQQRIRVWSRHQAEEALLKGSPFEGAPPVSSKSTDGYGVYFIDSTPGKMQRYMKQAVDLAQAVCETDGKRHVRVTVSLSNTVSPDLVPTLPDYVTGGGVSTDVGDMRVDTFVYAPPGSSMAGITRNGQPVDSTVTADGEYGVSRVGTTIAPGETVHFGFDVIATDDVLRKLKAQVTPVVSPTTVTESTLDCATIPAG